MPPPSAPSADERRTAELLAMLHQDNQNEIQLGKLAQERGQSKGVKQYGSMLVRDHTEADQKINDYAGRKNINLGSENEAAKKVAETGQQALEKLRGLEGNAFDREFASVMVRAHEEAVTLVKEGRQEVSDPELKTLLGKLQPVLEKHLEHAKTLQTGRAAASSEEEPAAPTQGRRPVSR
jgi:putative membrane protein